MIEIYKFYIYNIFFIDSLYGILRNAKESLYISYLINIDHESYDLAVSPRNGAIVRSEKIPENWHYYSHFSAHVGPVMGRAWKYEREAPRFLAVYD